MADFIQKRSSEWDEQAKIDAVLTYIKVGNNTALTCRTLNIPERTLMFWKKQEWWKELYDEFKSSEDFEISGKLERIIKISLAQVEDRLENGDPFYDHKSGTVKRKPASLRDLNAVLKDSLTAKVEIENKHTHKEETVSVMEKLRQLADQFEKIAQKKPQINVTDVVYIEENKDALHDKWEEGLQEGISEVPRNS